MTSQSLHRLYLTHLLHKMHLKYPRTAGDDALAGDDGAVDDGDVDNGDVDDNDENAPCSD